MFDRCLFLRACAVLVLCGLTAASSAQPDFQTQIEPILREHCYECHGPDKRKGGLRLSTRDAAMLGGDSGRPAIVAGDSAGSILIERILSTDPLLKMPMSGPPVPPEQVALLREWIDGGAQWASASLGEKASTPGHWAYQSPQLPEIPRVSNAGWPRNEIDHFLLARIEEAGIAPSPEADRHTLIRRLSLDLTGLPPSPAQIERFVNDDNEDAYRRLVESMLESPHYGEKQALHWLDAARYADTNGYEKDRHRNIWPYRDWVIDAFNKDIPFDRFVLEQIAGDMLPNATQDQKIATGFLRNSMWNEEGGVDVEEFRYEAMVDRVNAVSTVFLGLTLDCAQCHTHKYDDLTQREYFQFYSFLNNTDDVTVEVKSDRIERKRQRIAEEIQAAIRGLKANFPASASETPEAHRERRYQEWLAQQQQLSRDWQLLDPVDATSKNRATLEELEDHSILVTGDFPNTDEYTIDLSSNLQQITALRIEVLPHDSLPGNGPGRGVIMSDDGDFLLSELTAQAAPWSSPEAMQPLALQNATQSFAAEGKSAALALDGQLDTGWSINGGQGEPHWAVFEIAQPAGYPQGTLIRLKLDQYYVHQHTIGRLRVWATAAPLPVQALTLPPELERFLARGEAEAQRDALEQHFLLTAPELTAEQDRIAKLRDAMPEHPTSLALVERAHPRTAHIYHRGEFLKPREAVAPGVPAVLHDFPEHLPRTRLTFAHWLVDPENPLIARVTVNRVWQQLFGRGIVPTVDDFGLRGDPPTHPELLDWLALEFMRRGWSVKDLHRLIVTSAAYRQSSIITPEGAAVDPQNELLARAPRFRVDAQYVRDIALAASGLLNPQLGGPSVYPPMPPGMLDLAYGGGGAWPESTGPARYRRGLYTYWKRTMPYPTLTTFDAPAGDRTCVARTRSNTPLQALTMLNDVVYMEAARALAQRILAEGPVDTIGRIHFAFLIVLSREPKPEESTWIKKFLESQQRHAETLAQATVAPVTAASEPEATEAPELRAWTLVARVLLNLDETITRR